MRFITPTPIRVSPEAIAEVSKWAKEWKRRSFFSRIAKAAAIAVACPVILREAISCEMPARCMGVMEMLENCEPVTQMPLDLKKLIDAVYAIKRIREEMPGFTCPDCGMKTFHPEDKRNSYCGYCHEFK